MPLDFAAIKEIRSGFSDMLPSSKHSRNARIAGVDVIRVVSLVAIVIGHAYSNEWIDRSLQSWRLPIFFMLSGFFFTPHRSFEEDLKRRGRSLLIPYVVWGGILIVISVLLFNFDAAALIQQFLLGGSYAQRPLTTFWFLTALFAATLMYRALSKFNDTIIWAVVSVGLAANLVFGELMAKVPWSLATATGALFFIHLGSLIAKLHRWYSVKSIQMSSVAVLATCFLVLFLFPGDFEPLRMKQGVFPPLAVALSLFICSALISLGTTIGLPDRIASMVKLLAMPSLVVIALHPLLLIVFSGMVPYPLVPILAFTVSLAIGLVIIQTPFATILAGLPRLRKNQG